MYCSTKCFVPGPIQSSRTIACKQNTQSDAFLESVVTQYRIVSERQSGLSLYRITRTVSRYAHHGARVIGQYSILFAYTVTYNYFPQSYHWMEIPSNSPLCITSVTMTVLSRKPASYHLITVIQ